MSPTGTTRTADASPRVLLADDADRLRSLYRAVLEDDGRYQVVAEAADGEEAIQAADAHEPDLVLLDLSMPRLDGLEALEGIHEVAPDTEVIVLSGFQKDRFGDQARELGAVGYIEKGGSPQELLDEIDEILDGILDLADTPEADPPTEDAPPKPPVDPLKGPVEAVDAYVEEIVEGWPEDPVERPLTVAREQVETLRTRLEGLARLRRIAGTAPQRDRVPLDDVVESVESRLNGDLDDTALRFGDLPVVDADRDQVEAALAELVDNALAFGGASTIEIDAARTDDGWQIVVADDGQGLPEDRRDELLDPLETTGDPTEHPGLGLALARHVAHEHGGDVEIDDAPGGGTVVTLTLAHPDGREGSG